MCLRFLIVSFLILVTSNFASAEKKTAKAIFAGGCFWCMEEPFDKLDGVLSTTSGFSKESFAKPTQIEVVEIMYDPEKVSYEQLLEVFWKNIDPTNPDGQFCDRGPQYRSAIFYMDDHQKALAEESKRKIETTLGKQIVTPILEATPFVAAPEGHQDFYKKNALRYKQYKAQCGRDRRLKEIWKD
jgi:peptide-methionine (S)-S-oxide reductase